MHSGTGVVEQQCHGQAGRAVPIVSGSFWGAVGATPSLGRSRCGSRLGRDCGESAADTDWCPTGTASGSAAGHQSESESDSVASGSRCSWAEMSDVSQYNISRYCAFSDDNEGECRGSSSFAPGSSHSASHSLLSREEREVVEQRDTAWQARHEEEHAAHAAGTCRPCFHFSTKSGCLNGTSCNFCHFAHAIKPRSRPSKAARMQCKRLLETLDSKGEGDLHAALGLADALATRQNVDEYMLSLLRARGRQQAAGEGRMLGDPRGEPGRPRRHN